MATVPARPADSNNREVFMTQDRMERAVSKWGDCPSMRVVSGAARVRRFGEIIRRRPHWRTQAGVPMLSAQKPIQ